jgi:polyisoprenoid-binding protein YceI
MPSHFRIKASTRLARTLQTCGVGLASLVWAALPAQAQSPAPATYLLDPSHTQVTWALVHLGTSTMRGRFTGVSGHVTLDRAAGKGELSVQIPTASVSSGVVPLDSLLRGDGMLRSEAHPLAYFVASQFNFEDGKLSSVRGEFTLRGISQPLSLRAVRFGCYAHPQLQREVCGGDFEGEILRSSFQIDHSLPFIADRVDLRIQVEGVKQ